MRNSALHLSDYPSLRWFRWVVLCAILIVSTGAFAAEAHAQVEATVQMDTLAPAFDATILDYTFDCSAERMLRIASPQPFSVEGGAEVTGGVTASVVAKANQAVHWTIAGTSYQARCLPLDFPKFTVTTTGRSTADWYATTPGNNSYAFFMNHDGVPVWWPATIFGVDLKVLSATSVAMYTQDSSDCNPNCGSFHILNWDGGVSGKLYDLDFHDLVQRENGNYIGIRYVHRACSAFPSIGCTDGEIVERNSSSEPLKVWSALDHIGILEYDRDFLATMGSDIIHINSVAWDNGGVIFSARHTNAVYRIDWATGAITWKLGGTYVEGESLDIKGDPAYGATSFGGQHDARVLSRDGSTVQISVSDNGTFRDRAPRGVVYNIDETAMTATLVESASLPSVEPTSPAAGSARRLSNGHWVMQWGGMPRFDELDAAGVPVFTTIFKGSTTSYRTVPVLASDYPGVDLHSVMVAGMDTQGGASTVVIKSPAAPTDLVATPGNAQVSVAFTAGSDNGSAITDYSYSIDNGSHWTSLGITASPATITGLTNGTAYSIMLLAHNSAGDGAASISTSSVTPYTTPGPPTGLIATPGNRQVSIAFTAGSDNGRPITDYAYSIDNGSQWISLGTSTSPVTITGLTNGTRYSIMLRSHSIAGDSPPSATITATPPTLPTTPSGIRWTGSLIPGSPFEATFAGQYATTYTITGSVTSRMLTQQRATKTARGVCTVRTNQHTRQRTAKCTIRFNWMSTWLVKITPTKNGVVGTPATKAVTIRAPRPTGTTQPTEPVTA